MAPTHLPRVVVAGLSGDSGKSLVSLGLIRALCNKGSRVAPFKKGPDYIDAAWLSSAAGAPGRNLDTFLMPQEAILASFSRSADWAEIAVTEGNRGLYDGMTATGDHSTAELAKLLSTPVILVVDCTKSTRTVAALVRGCQVLDEDVNLAGVVLNRVATHRQEKVIREAVRLETGVEVVGAVPKLNESLLPSRHLGLVTAMEHPDVDEALERAGEIVGEHIDLHSVVSIAQRAPTFESGSGEASKSPRPPFSKGETTAGASPHTDSKKVPFEKGDLGNFVIGATHKRRIGVLKDKAFSFYYPENLEALEFAGAELVYISPLRDETLPDIEALYAGGGFPEVYAAELSDNQPFRDALASRIEAGLPVWAECGGLMYLSQSLTQDNQVFPMVGAIGIDVLQTPKPAGHGYVRARVDRANPFFDLDFELKGHEFHYSRVSAGLESVVTVFSMERGQGVGKKRDGIHRKNVVATYTHLHALGTPHWAEAFMGVLGGNI